MAEIDKTKTNPGIHKQLKLQRFGDREETIIKELARQWYLTSSGNHLHLGSTEFDYFLNYRKIKLSRNTSKLEFARPNIGFSCSTNSDQ